MQYSTSKKQHLTLCTHPSSHTYFIAKIAGDLVGLVANKLPQATHSETVKSLSKKLNQLTYKQSTFFISTPSSFSVFKMFNFKMFNSKFILCTQLLLNSLPLGSTSSKKQINYCTYKAGCDSVAIAVFSLCSILWQLVQNSTARLSCLHERLQQVAMQ